MDVGRFRAFLRKGGRSPTAAERAIEHTRQFEDYLAGQDIDLDDASPDNLECFVASVESEPKVSAKLHLWGLHYYYEFVDDPIMEHFTWSMRRERVEQTPFHLGRFRGVQQSTTTRLAAVGVKTVEGLLASSVTATARSSLALRAGISSEELDELVRLSDLARIGGLKSIRARLYLDAGVDSVAALAAREPAELVGLLERFVTESGFEGMAPLPGEVGHAVEAARKLDPLIEW